MSKLRINELESLETGRSLKVDEMAQTFDYKAGIKITSYSQMVRDDNGEFWRVSGQVDLPYTTTGTGLPEGDAFVPVGDAVLRQELAVDGSELVTVSTATGTQSIAAALDSRVIYVDSIADLQALPTDELVDGQQVSVLSFHPPLLTSAKSFGGGTFCWSASQDQSAHDGGRIIDPSATFPMDWNNQVSVSNWLKHSGAGSGAFTRLSPLIYIDDYGASPLLNDNKVIFQHVISIVENATSSNIDSEYPQGALLRLSPLTYNISGTIDVNFSLAMRGENANKTFNSADAGTVLKFTSGGFYLKEGHFRFDDFTVCGEKTGTIDVNAGQYGNAGMLFNNNRGEFNNVEVRDFDCGIVYRNTPTQGFGGAYRVWTGSRILRNEYNIVSIDYVTDARFNNCSIMGNPADVDGNKRGYVRFINPSEGYMSATFSNCLLEGLGGIRPGYDYVGIEGVYVGGKNAHLKFVGGYSESVNYYADRGASLTRDEFIKNTAIRTTGGGLINISGSYARSEVLEFGDASSSNWVSNSVTRDGFDVYSGYAGEGYTITDEGAYPQIEIAGFDFMRQVTASAIGDCTNAEYLAVTMQVDFYAPAGAGAVPQIRVFSEVGEIAAGDGTRYRSNEMLAPAGKKRLHASLHLSAHPGDVSYFRPRIDFVGNNGDQIVIKRIRFIIHA